jgi:Tol biopolymer transport system component
MKDAWRLGLAPRSRSAQVRRCRVYVLELRTGRVTRVTADDAAEASPAFAANGRSVVYASNRTGTETLWRVPATGGTALPVVAPGGAAKPAIRPQPRLVELLPDLGVADSSET